jgi:hypothetical protein
VSEYVTVIPLESFDEERDREETTTIKRGRVGEEEK